VTLVPIGQGIAASLIATLMVGAWIAIGSIFLKGFKSTDGITAPAAILIGSGITSFVLALFCVRGMVWTGTVVVAAASTVMVVIQWRRMWAIATGIFDPFVALTRQWVLLAFGLILWVILWAAAIYPPRSADAMRYHLAHIRQIVSDGRWERIADYHYALPFGWSLSYLPFEMLGLPQGSQLLDLALLVVFVSTTVRIFKWAGASRSAVVLSLLMVLHPASLRVFTEANADAYAILAIIAMAALILRLSSLRWSEAALLGFVSCIGLQSRYQLVAAAIAVAIVFLISIRRHPARLAAVFAYLGGSVVALVLASPFYFMNQKWFGNPVWPLLIEPSSTMSYADTVAYTYSKSLSGSYSLKDYAEGIWTLLTVPFLFPLAILIVGSIGIAAIRKGREIQALGLFGALFLLQWAIMQPLLYPRFVLMMLPVAVLCTGFLLSSVIQERERLDKLLVAVGSVGVVAMVVLAAAVNRDSLRFAISNDQEEYHRYTWFFPVYEWANLNARIDSRFLVVVSSAHTYYLDRPYRRADPWVSPTVDWPATNTGAKLDSLLARDHYRYVIYENRNWTLFPGGSDMQNAVLDAYREGLLKKVVSFEDTLFTSRARRTYRTTRVHVLERSRR